MNFTEKQKAAIEILRRPNFSPEDFFRSDTAAKMGIINLPATESEAKIVIERLTVVADKMQQIRGLLGCPININSSYRCEKLNKAVGSKGISQHLKGEAVDFVCPAFGNPAAIFAYLIKNKIEVDQCLMEATWIHLSIKKSDNRNLFAKLINGIYTPIKH